jgi:Rad3-related DNA helicase
MLDVAHTSPNDILVVLNQDDNSLSIKCINDALLAEKLVHCNTAAQLWMSATIGDIDTYAKLNGITNYKAYSMSTNFTFDKSPIYLSKPAISLSYANIDKNLAELVSRVEAICAKYPFDNILVHTSTKRITNHLMQNVNQYNRLKTYGNAAEKQKLVSELNKNTNFIVVGHSLQEGVDLYDDKCRVIIVAKLSWPSLGDLVVKTKADNHGDWYILKVFQHFVQSIGRGIRNNKDWCITYVLDSSFGRIKQQLKFTPLIAQRLIDGDDLHGHVEPTKTTEELDAIAAAAQAPPTLQF